MKAYISAISYSLPKKVLTNEELADIFPEWSVEKIANKVGIKTRHIADEGETAVDLAVTAAETLFSEYNLDRNKIDFVLFCTQSPDYLLPASACIIQHRLKLATSVGAVDINQGCSGYIYGLSLAKGLISANIAKQVLLLTGDTYSKYIHELDKGNRTIFGDAATATLVTNDQGLEIGSFILGTNGGGAEDLIIRTGGARNRTQMHQTEIDDAGNIKSANHLFMDGAEIFKFTSENVPQLVDETLKANLIQMCDVNSFIFHQANKYMINYLRKRIKIPEEKFPIYMESVGNTVSSSIPIVLAELRKDEKLTGNILLAGFGVGFSWGGVVIRSK